LEKSQKTLQQLKALKTKVGRYENLVSTYEDILTLIEMGIEEQDESVYEEVKTMRDTFASMTVIMPLLPFMLAQVAQRLVTGQTCCSVCIANGPQRQATKWKSWTCRMVMKQG